MLVRTSRYESNPLNHFEPATEFATRHASPHRGASLMICVVALIPLLGITALAVDLGRLHLLRTEMQRSADAGALTATQQLLHPDRLKPVPSSTAGISNARDKSVSYAGANHVDNRSLVVDRNDSNNSAGDVVVGFLANPKNQLTDMTYLDPNKYNSVRVRVQLTSQRNGSVPLLLAGVLGKSSKELKTSATATIQDTVRGFRVTEYTGNARLLPIKLHVALWASLFTAAAGDDYSWKETMQSVVAGADGIKEVSFFPETDVPGNFGYLSIGSASNGNGDLIRQIQNGVSERDLVYHGGQFELNNAGVLQLNGVPGNRNSVLAALATIVGETRAIPLYSTTTGNASNSVVTVVGFAGVRIMHVQTSGVSRITIQPAHVIDDSVIVGSGPQQSKFVYAPVQLSR